MTTPVLRVKSLDSGYAEATVLHAVDFELQQGEIFGLLGKNGMGKSTLLKCIMGFLPKTAGQVELDGLDISGLPPHLIARAGIGYVAQEKALFQDLTVEENIRLGVRDRLDRRGAGRDRSFVSLPAEAAWATRRHTERWRTEDAADCQVRRQRVPPAADR